MARKCILIFFFLLIPVFAFAKPEMIFVKGGCFQMGDTFGKGRSNEKPVHKVCVDDFYIGKYEVTQTEWMAVMQTNPSSLKKCDNCPVDSVSYQDARVFIKKLKGQSGKKYRLPTEAEWEYAARSGGKKEVWAGTSDAFKLDDYAWYEDNSGGKMHPIGTSEPNSLGTYDMSGNVWEWVWDYYAENYYKISPEKNPIGLLSGKKRVLRGGSWLETPKDIRAANRHKDYPDNRSDSYGFRLALPSHK